MTPDQIAVRLGIVARRVALLERLGASDELRNAAALADALERDNRAAWARWKVALPTAALLALGALPVAAATPGHQPTVVCHWTPDHYQRIVIDDDGLHGHDHHAKDVVNPPGGSCPAPPTATVAPTATRPAATATTAPPTATRQAQATTTAPTPTPTLAVPHGAQPTATPTIDPPATAPASGGSPQPTATPTQQPPGGSNPQPTATATATTAPAGGSNPPPTATTTPVAPGLAVQHVNTPPATRTAVPAQTTPVSFTPAAVPVPGRLPHAGGLDVLVALATGLAAFGGGLLLKRTKG